MSVLTHSRDIFLSTNQSGRVGAGESQFSKFRMCLNTLPLTCEAGEMTKLSLTQFSCFRNFYYINQLNNRIDVSWDGPGNNTGTILLDPGDYTTVNDIAAEFTNKLKAFFANAGGAGTNIDFEESNQRPDGGAPGADPPRIAKLRKYGVTLTYNGHGITNLVLQTRQYKDGTPHDVINGSTQFGDSYCILGSKRIGAPNPTANSFYIAIAANTIDIAGYYPMQTTSMQYMYMRCSEVADNIQSQNLTTDEDVPDSHMTSSHILAKIPVDDQVCSLQYESSPYFLNSNNRHISELRFRLIDHHARPIPLMNSTIELDGNLFSNMTFKVETFAIGGNEHTLNAPFQNYHYEGNPIKQIHGIVG